MGLKYESSRLKCGHHLSIVGPASIYFVKINLTEALAELLEGVGRGGQFTVCVQLAKLAELSEGGRVSP